MCPDAASAEDLMTAEDRHIKSITVCMSANCGSSQTIVAYDIREDVCNDSCHLNLQWKMQEYLVFNITPLLPYDTSD